MTRSPQRSRMIARALASFCVACGVGVGAAWVAPHAGAVSRAQALGLAKSRLLRLSDLPAGWKAVTGVTTGGGGAFPGARRLARCIGVPASVITANPPEANSPDFQSKDGSLGVQDSVSVFPNARFALAELQAIGDPKTPRCMAVLANTPSYKAKLLGSSGRGTTLGRILVTPLAPGTFGTGAAGFTITVPVRTGRAVVTSVLTEVFAIRGRLGVQISFNSYDAAFPAALAAQLAQVAEQRL
jgi:hypothetical protein